MNLKVIHLTETCDMIYREDDEIFYVIHAGENEGVTFTLLDLVISIVDGQYKHDYLPLIIENSYNAPVKLIYNEIFEVVQAKVKLYMDKIK